MFSYLNRLIFSFLVLGIASIGAFASEYEIEFYSGVVCDESTKVILSSLEYKSETGISEVCVEDRTYLKYSNIESIEAIKPSDQSVFSEIEKEFEEMNIMDIPGVVSIGGVVEPAFRIVIDEEGAGRLKTMLVASDTLHIVYNLFVVSTIYSLSDLGGNTLLIFGDSLSEEAKDIFRGDKILGHP